MEPVRKIPIQSRSVAGKFLSYKNNRHISYESQLELAFIYHLEFSPDVQSDAYTIKLNTGLIVKFLGVKIINEQQVLEYLKNKIKGKDVYLKFDKNSVSDENVVWAYVYLKNKIFVNAYLIKSRFAVADKTKDYRYKAKFMKLEKEIKR